MFLCELNALLFSMLDFVCESVCYWTWYACYV